GGGRGGDGVSDRGGGGGAKEGGGQRTAGRKGQLHRRSGVVAHRRRVHHGAPRPDRVHGRVAEPAGVGGGGPHPLPRERRRQPRPPGVGHAAPGGAATPHPSAAGGPGRGVRGR